MAIRDNPLNRLYSENIDRESAYEKLHARQLEMEAAAKQEKQKNPAVQGAHQAAEDNPSARPQPSLLHEQLRARQLLP